MLGQLPTLSQIFSSQLFLLNNYSYSSFMMWESYAIGWGSNCTTFIHILGYKRGIRSHCRGCNCWSKTLLVIYWCNIVNSGFYVSNLMKFCLIEISLFLVILFLSYFEIYCHWMLQLIFYSCIAMEVWFRCCYSCSQSLKLWLNKFLCLKIFLHLSTSNAWC